MAGALSLWLFVVFKGACVRQGDHLLLAGPGALLAILLVATLVPKRRWLRALLALSLLLAWSAAESASGQRWQIPREVVRTFTTIPDSFAWLGQRVERSNQWPTARPTWIDPRKRPDFTHIHGPVGVFPFADFDFPPRLKFVF